MRAVQIMKSEFRSTSEEEVSTISSKHCCDMSRIFAILWVSKKFSSFSTVSMLLFIIMNKCSVSSINRTQLILLVLDYLAFIYQNIQWRTLNTGLEYEWWLRNSYFVQTSLDLINNNPCRRYISCSYWTIFIQKFIGMCRIISICAAELEVWLEKI